MSRCRTVALQPGSGAPGRIDFPKRYESIIHEASRERCIALSALPAVSVDRPHERRPVSARRKPLSEPQAAQQIVRTFPSGLIPPPASQSSNRPGRENIKSSEPVACFGQYAEKIAAVGKRVSAWNTPLLFSPHRIINISSTSSASACSTRCHASSGRDRVGRGNAAGRR